MHDYGDVCQAITELAVELTRRSARRISARSTDALRCHRLGCSSSGALAQFPKTVDLAASRLRLYCRSSEVHRKRIGLIVARLGFAANPTSRIPARASSSCTCEARRA